MFHTADDEAIRDGRVTDVYFARTLEILEKKGMDRRVRAEFFTKKMPEGRGWGVLAGIEEAARLMEGKNVDIRAMEEGEVFCPWEPVMEIEGPYTAFCVFETALLGLICQASGVASKAARIRLAAGERTVVSFGARRMHPAIAPMIERAAYIGGCDGVAVIASAELLELDPVGTMPHALILVTGDTVEAARAFDEVIDKSVKRVALVDTFNDEKWETLRVAEAMKGSIYGVRLDTPASRRGDFLKIFEEVRWELDLRGFGDIRLFASGGLNEAEVAGLKGVVDAFGVGTCISNAPVIDFAMDIVEIDGVPVAKKGKWSGAKEVSFCPACGKRKVAPLGKGPDGCECGGGFESLLKPMLNGGRIVRELPKPGAIRGHTLSRLKYVSL